MSIWTFKLVVNIKAIYFYPLGIFFGISYDIYLLFIHASQKKLTPSRKKYLAVAF